MILPEVPHGAEQHERVKIMKITDSVQAQVKKWSAGYKAKNQDALMDAEDFADIALVKWSKKSRFYNPSQGTMEQFTGLICANVESELADKLKREKKARGDCESLDSPVATNDPNRKMTLADRIAESSTDLKANWLRYDVRETIKQMPKELAEVMIDCMAGRSVREMARRANLPRNTFVYARWNPAVQLFKKIFGQIQSGDR